MCNKNTCENCIEKTDICKIDELIQENTALKNRAIKIDRELTEALSVIQFYADKGNWYTGYYIYQDTFDNIDMDAEFIAGKLAREFLKKITGE